MRIGIASDHAGYELKSEIIKELENSTHHFVDYGCDSALISVDYPDLAYKLSRKLIAAEIELGILICGSGVGISIAANRFKEIRAALCHNPEIATLAVEHNNANVLCLGARIIKKETAMECVKSFLSAKFAGGRHQNRIDKLSNAE